MVPANNHGGFETGTMPALLSELSGPDSVEDRVRDPAHAPPSLRNVFACLVHESPECVVDLVQNLRHLDSSSEVLLYNGSSNPDLLTDALPLDRHLATVHPSPRSMHWGRLHNFAIDCMSFALDHLPFDTMTIVDSDQLAMRPGYSTRLAAFLAGEYGVGLLSNAPEVQRPGTRVQPARVAHAEIDMWRPFLGRFPDGESKFVHWGFWPSTVFTADAARALVKLFREDSQLQQLLRDTRVWATEEVVLPTLVALLGFRIVANPCSFDFVRYRTPYSVAQLDGALHRADVFWAHPIPRQYDDSLRKHIRGQFCNYGTSVPRSARPVPDAADSGRPPFVLVRALLARMRNIEGWLSDDEADLLIGASIQALHDLAGASALVEVGSYCGRSTVLLAGVAAALRPTARVWAIDPHDGKLGSADQYVTVGPSLEKLKANIAAAGFVDSVEIVQATAPQVAWSEPIALLLIDGLHDYASVGRDFAHFEPWVADGGYIAFHDYASYFAGVVAFVDELLASGRFGRVALAGTLIVLRKVVRPSPNGDGKE